MAGRAMLPRGVPEGKATGRVIGNDRLLRCVRLESFAYDMIDMSE